MTGSGCRTSGHQSEPLKWNNGLVLNDLKNSGSIPQKTIDSGESRQNINSAYLIKEEDCVHQLIAKLNITPAMQHRIRERARGLVQDVRRRQSHSGIQAFMHEYDLSSREGVALMCLAEALLRIPDSKTADRLIRDKLIHTSWEKHLGQSRSLFVNASTWGLMLTGRIVDLPSSMDDLKTTVQTLLTRSGETLIRKAIRQGMRIIAHQFVLGTTISDAVENGGEDYNKGYRYSFDMLGEEALTQEDADKYFNSYSDAIDYLGKRQESGSADSFSADSISVKLSALHPRYQFLQRERVIRELVPRVLVLAKQAMRHGIGLTLDAEEADRLNLMLDIFEALFKDKAFTEWEGFGLAVQTYQKRAFAVTEWLMKLARAEKRRIPIRLVKGAYWDTEIKHAQELGLSDYPVFTRKAATDLSFLTCASHILQATDCFYPQFASHNAHSVAAVLEMGEGHPGFEFQRLHGMGQSLYDSLLDYGKVGCRIYAPVGNHEELLPYLVRRLLENGANSSFVNRIEDETIPIDRLIADPLTKIAGYNQIRHSAIPLPENLYGSERLNSVGLNLDNPEVVQKLRCDLDEALNKQWKATPVVAGERLSGSARPVINPADHNRQVGEVLEADETAVEQAISAGSKAAESWAGTDPDYRATLLDKSAELFERTRAELVALCVSEGGRTIPDALSEVREAADFCRYYAYQLRSEFGQTKILPGPTGEENRLSQHGRGLFVCISPWNFPIAIFTGQISAALAAGNSVIAKPAGQTPLVGMRVVELLQEAGVPADIVQYLPGSGSKLGPLLTSDERVAGVAFTGSTQTARQINQTLAARPGAIVPFIAETGGQNAMIVDSSALLEQAVTDAIQSAFNSAGQRCSALRVLFVQQDIERALIRMLQGAMEELSLGDPMKLSTDVGPVIDMASHSELERHVAYMKQNGELLYTMPLSNACKMGSYFPPRLYKLDKLSLLREEVFGPILHIIPWSANALDTVIDAIKQTGYGLTLGIHSRIDQCISYIQQRLPIGNTYVNRNMIGAVVGVQPFGGERLSGTGPKAGGPHTLLRYATERSLTINTAAVGGNTQLLALDDC